MQSQDAEAHYYPIFRHTDAPDETTLRHFPSSTGPPIIGRNSNTLDIRVIVFDYPCKTGSVPEQTHPLSLSLSLEPIFSIPLFRFELICGRGTKVISADIFIFYVPFIRSLTRRIFSILKNGRIFNINTRIFLLAMEGQYLSGVIFFIPFFFYRSRDTDISVAYLSIVCCYLERSIFFSIRGIACNLLSKRNVQTFVKNDRRISIERYDVLLH